MSKKKEYAGLPVQVRAVDSERRVISFIASDETVDRYNTVITAGGWNLTHFRSNPMFLFGHNYREPWAVTGRIIGIEKDADKGELGIDVMFVPEEINPVAEMVYQMYAHKPPFLNAVSVGFIPLKVQKVDAEEEAESVGKDGKDKQRGPKRKVQMRYLQQELLEVSAVTVPANPNALKKAFDDWKEDGVDPVVVMNASTVLPEGDAEEKQALNTRVLQWARDQGFTEGIPMLEVDGEDAAFIQGRPLPELDLDDDITLQEEEERAGAVLNARNKADLKQAMVSIQRVLDSSEPPSEESLEQQEGVLVREAEEQETQTEGDILRALSLAVTEVHESVGEVLSIVQNLWDELISPPVDAGADAGEGSDDETPAGENDQTGISRLDTVLAQVGVADPAKVEKVIEAVGSVGAMTARLEQALISVGVALPQKRQQE